MKRKNLTPYWGGFFFIPSATFLSQVVFNQCASMYLVRFGPCAPLVGEYQTGADITWESQERNAWKKLCASDYVHLLVVFENVQHCTWLGFFLPPAVRDSGRKNHLGE